MGNTLNYYRDMKETLLDQRKKRIGRNDFKRSMAAKRDAERDMAFSKFQQTIQIITTKLN